MNRQRSTDNDRGSIALIAALVLVVMMGMGALVLDGGFRAIRRRQIQAAADAAALAGGLDLPSSGTATTAATANLNANGYPAGATVSFPSSRIIRVVVTKSVPTFLGKALKINNGVVTGTAEVTSPQTDVVFSGDQVCSDPGTDLVINGSDTTFGGGIHSNGSIQFGANAATTVPTVESGNLCPANVGGPTVGSGPTNVPWEPYPLTWVLADFPCTWTIPGGNISLAGAWWQNATTLRPGVYCPSAGSPSLQINGGPVTGNVTFASSGLIQINGNNLNFTAFRNNVLAYTSMATNTTTNAIQLGNQSLTWTGAVFAPNGHIAINGQDFNITGSIIGKSIQLGPTRWTVNGGAGGGSPYLSQ